MPVLARSTLPNAITVARMALAPVVFFLVFVPSFGARFVAWIFFLIAAFSDLWDGYLARKHGWISNFGMLVDPIADKLLLVSTFIPFYVLSNRAAPEGQLPLIGALPLWVVLVVLGREFLVTVLRSLVARRGIVIPAGRAGKLKAVFQNIFSGATILWFALQTAAYRGDWAGTAWDTWQVFHGFVVVATLVIAVTLTISSMIVYLWDWRRLVRAAM
ncbi:MAG: CDP-diacylglycerol--glycerol-3-phosphate 3-phosphatidyltransferase [Longimicrobiales bacterium]